MAFQRLTCPLGRRSAGSAAGVPACLLPANVAAATAFLRPHPPRARRDRCAPGLRPTTLAQLPASRLTLDRRPSPAVDSSTLSRINRPDPLERRKEPSDASSDHEYKLTTEPPLPCCRRFHHLLPLVPPAEHLLLCHAACRNGACSTGLRRRLVLCDPCQYAQHQQPVTVGHIDRSPRHEPNVADAGCGDDLQELLQLDRPASQPVSVIDDHRITVTLRQIRQHRLIAGSLLARVRRDVVVDLLLSDRPTQLASELAAVLDLAGSAQRRAVIRRDPCIHRCSCHLSHKGSY